VRAIHTFLWNLADQKDTEMKLAKVLMLFVVLHFTTIANPNYTILPKSGTSSQHLQVSILHAYQIFLLHQLLLNG